jgi:hypothetical protein
MRRDSSASLDGAGAEMPSEGRTETNDTFPGVDKVATGQHAGLHEVKHDLVCSRSGRLHEIGCQAGAIALVDVHEA